MRNFVINGVDVPDFVDAELDRRHPERVQLGQIRSADDFRAMWDTVERLWSEAVARAERLPEAALHERVDDEWSFVETLRHLVFITDSWASRTVLDEADALPPARRHPDRLSAATPRRSASISTPRPSFAEVLEVRADRMALMRRHRRRPHRRRPRPDVLAVAGTRLSRGAARSASASRVVMDEECEHYRFASRDLAVLEARAGRGPGEHGDAPSA